MKIKKFLPLLFVVLFICGIEINAQSEYHKAIPEISSPPRLVNDFADMMSNDEERKLEARLLAFENESSNQITIVTVTDLDGMEISQFALELGRKWDIGQKSKKNGVVVLASKNDHKINISPAYGLSGVLPDITCGRIIREQIVPNFRQENYYRGFDEAVTSIIAATKGEFTNDAVEGQPIPAWVVLLMLLLFMGAIFFVFYIMRNSKNIYVSRRGYKYNDDNWGHGGGWFGGFGGGGGGGWGGDDSGGGGFGGFGGGGGGFDGGGASGSW